MENLRRKLLVRLSEKEGKLKITGELLGKDEFAKEMDLDIGELESQLNLLQDDNLLECEAITPNHFDFRVTADGLRFLQNTSED